MLKIIDTEQKFSEFLNIYKDFECIIYPILSDENKHIILNSICLLFIRLLNNNEDYVLCFEHNEAQHLPIEVLIRLDSEKNKYVIDKKFIRHKLQLSHMIDLSLIHWINTLKPIEISKTTTSAHVLIYSNFRMFINVNRAIPILMYYQSIKQMFTNIEKDILDARTMVNNTELPYFNEIMSENLRKIEGNGLHIDLEEAQKHWTDIILTNNANNDFVYSEYNMYTITGRPSNRFGGINFAALNKSDDTRKIFTSRYNCRYSRL